MKLNEIATLKQPSKKEEEFRKISFKKLFSYDFKNIKKYSLNIKHLEEEIDTLKYENLLFDITKNFDKKQSVLTINENLIEPIIIRHELNEDETFYTNSLKIKVKEGIKATVIEIFKNSSSNSAYSVNRNFVLEKNSDFEYAKIQEISEDNFLIYNANFEQEDNSSCKLTNYEFGEGFIINNFINIIANSNIKYELAGLVKSKKTSNTANLIRTVHNNESSISDIKYNHILEDESTAIFKAKSIVNKKALYSKAFQNSHTILLSDDATIFAQPHLEILIDELEASHGATTGTLDRDQLLYLQSRGISKMKSYEILLKAFEDKITDNINDILIKKFIKKYQKGLYV